MNEHVWCIYIQIPLKKTRSKKFERISHRQLQYLPKFIVYHEVQWPDFPVHSIHLDDQRSIVYSKHEKWVLDFRNVSPILLPVHHLPYKPYLLISTLTLIYYFNKNCKLTVSDKSTTTKTKEESNASMRAYSMASNFPAEKGDSPHSRTQQIW